VLNLTAFEGVLRLVLVNGCTKTTRKLFLTRASPVVIDTVGPTTATLSVPGVLSWPLSTTETVDSQLMEELAIAIETWRGET
jgi:hypothetical protein